MHVQNVWFYTSGVSQELQTISTRRKSLLLMSDIAAEIKQNNLTYPGCCHQYIQNVFFTMNCSSKCKSHK